MRLRLRLSLVLGALGLMTIASVSSIAWWRAASETRASIDAELEQRFAPALARLDGAGRARPVVVDTGTSDVDTIDELPAPEILGTDGDLTQFLVLLADGSTRGFDGAEPTVAAISSLESADSFFESTSVEGTPYRVLTLPFDTTGLVEEGLDVPEVVGVQLYRDVSNEESTLDRLAVQLAVLSAIGVAAVAGASWLIGRWIAAPVDRLAATAERLATLEDIPGRVEVNRSDEIGRLAASFNRLMSALEIGREQQRRLVADASHELRTPLTSLRMRLDHLDQHDVSAERRVELVRAALGDAERLSVLVVDVVDLAADLRTGDEPPRTLQLCDVLEEVANRVRVSSLRRIEVDADQAIVEIRPTMVERAVHNLLDNAIKYGSDDGPIVVWSRAGRIEVRDDGPGIADDDADHVFDRFYRSPRARNRPGNGIGLSIVQQVADAHGGTTWIDRRREGGAAVGFSVVSCGDGR